MTIGTHMFYPSHGVVAIVAVEQRSFDSCSQSFFSLSLESGERLFLPVDKVDHVGLRKLVSKKSARELLRQVCDDPAEQPDPDARKRATYYQEELRTGSAEGYTRVLQALLFIAKAKKLSDAEKRLLEVARGYFVSELSMVLEVTKSEVFGRLESR